MEAPSSIKPTKSVHGLQRQVGLLGGVSIIVGTMIGSGIFASPKWVAINAGSVGMTLVVWSLGGLLSVLGSLGYIELGLAISKSGGEYTYFKEAFGPVAAFLYSWTCVLTTRPASLAITLLTFAYYVLEPFYPCSGRDDLIPAVKLLAATAIGKGYVIIYCACSLYFSNQPHTSKCLYCPFLDFWGQL